MIKLENWEVVGWEHAIRGMRNPMNSWDRMDSKRMTSTLKEEEVCPGVTALVSTPCEPYISVGDNDHDLMMRLAKGGPVHAKYRRMITVSVDITAPLYWWKEFDTYKVGTVCNSCSTMHKIHAKEFTVGDFSHEYLGVHPNANGETESAWNFEYFLLETIRGLNAARAEYLKTKDMFYWRQMIQLLPTSYNQKRTIMLNYEVLVNIYESRKNHKLDEWRTLCDWIKSLPYSELITGEVTDNAQTTLL